MAFWRAVGAESVFTWASNRSTRCWSTAKASREGTLLAAAVDTDDGCLDVDALAVDTMIDAAGLDLDASTSGADSWDESYMKIKESKIDGLNQCYSVLIILY